MPEVEVKSKEELCVRLGEFLSIYHKAKIIEPKEDTLKMYILLSKNKNGTPKEKLINFKLLIQLKYVRTKNSTEENLKF